MIIISYILTDFRVNINSLGVVVIIVVVVFRIKVKVGMAGDVGLTLLCH